MPLTQYKVWAIGSPVGVGVTGAINVAFAAVAKKATLQSPYIVSNEILCNQLARTLLLPCPPGGLLSHNGENYFATLNFNVGGLSLPPANPAMIVRNKPELSWGIILFDILAMNADRHTGNISHDRSTNNIQIFDHSHAFIGTEGNVSSILARRVDLISIGGHCLAREIDRANGFQMWCGRIKALPDFFLEGIVDAACGLGIPGSHKGECLDALRKRRDKIEDLVKQNLGCFPKLQNGAI